MALNSEANIVIKGAKTNNLKDISLEIPHNKFIVVTGVSGSGKSSLVFDIIAKEGQRRYFETLPSFSRQFLGKLNRPNVEVIDGLSPVIAIGQKTTGMHTRSTVGTLSDLYDLLRLLYARTGKTSKDLKLSRALFSFNSVIGKCPSCNGIGKQEEIDLDKLVSQPKKTIREGALAPTLPNGYIMYSQVTIDVLNQVCEAEGFNVDIPWNELTEQQQNVILFGSNKIKVPFGKHSLESRLKWTGIKAKPREEGFYKGMIPIMSDILRRDRNANILKYVKSVTCKDCNGTRLNQNALSVTLKNKTIADLVALEISELNDWIKGQEFDAIATEILTKIQAQIELLEDLGLGHLTINRSSNTLRPSEIQRIRIANQILVPLSDVLFVFDEPSIGLHKEENERLVYHLKGLVEKGNTVIVVEHNLDTISNADHIIEIGPKAGKDGGELIFNGPFSSFINQTELKEISVTYTALTKQISLPRQQGGTNPDFIHLYGCSEKNLKNVNAKFKIGALNVVSGKSGAGKSSLVKSTLMPLVNSILDSEKEKPLNVKKHSGLESFDKLIFIDHSPIGKTPRSNPATYLGLSDHIRDIFAKLPESKTLGYTKSRYSFNNKGGRCETCQGAGKTQIGMHFLGNVDLVCGTCNGDRFNKETLAVKYKGKSIAAIYKLSVNEAVSFFKDDKKVLHGLLVLQEIGLGYLTLGQSSTTLSGGEAQRIKIANQLQKKDTGNTLYVIIEPSIGLHQNNINSLLQLFSGIKSKGNTIVCIEQNERIINESDWHIELGPDGGVYGGEILYQGELKEVKLEQKQNNITVETKAKKAIKLNGVTTNGLKNIDVSIPKNKLTVVTGLSGSGKSSLVYDTLFAESNARFTESLSTYNRSFLKQNNEAIIESFSGLGPSIGINRKSGVLSKRSTVGTLSGVYDAFRLMYSRIAQEEGEFYTAQHFSFNSHLGACPHCKGLGKKPECNPDEIIVHPEKSLLNGAISTNKTIAYYGDSNGQFVAILKEVAKNQKWDINVPFNEQTEEVQDIILYGTGENMWDTKWEFTTKTRSGVQDISAKWLGFCNYINDEYQRKINNKNIQSIEELLHDVKCENCNGSRLKPELLQTQFLGLNIHEICELSISECYNLLNKNKSKVDKVKEAISKSVLPTIKNILKTIIDLGLGYLTINRSIKTMSGGERQRITLAGQLSANLFGVTYVLDEPSIGLDERQVVVLTDLLKNIVSKGNTVVVVEHDATFIRNADYLIEMGPAAGVLGGEVVYQGSVKNISECKVSVTAKMLNAQTNKIERHNNIKGGSFGVKGAFANNLKNIDVVFNSKQITAVKGVSGSGKSSLIKNVLYNSWLKNRAINCSSVFGLKQFEEVLLIDQNPIKQDRLSTVASFTGVLDQIKAEFSKTEIAEELGLKKADFSYLSKSGKCTTCSGYGKLKTSMDFMSDIWLTCDSCNGMRYNEKVLLCNYKGYSIGEVLKLTIQEATTVFDNKTLQESLTVLIQVGLEHLHLGQSGNNLSGGEAQRLKLATSLLKKRKGFTLYLFDEPSTGLHYFDIRRLQKVFQSIIGKGDTVLFIEHNKTLMQFADQIITLGPGSGIEGGEIVL